MFIDRGLPWRRAWQPTPVFLPGEVHGQRSLVGYSPWGRKELDRAGPLMYMSTHTHTQRWREDSVLRLPPQQLLWMRSGIWDGKASGRLRLATSGTPAVEVCGSSQDSKPLPFPGPSFCCSLCFSYGLLVKALTSGLLLVKFLSFELSLHCELP